MAANYPPSTPDPGSIGQGINRDAGVLDQAAALEREHPLPIVDPDLGHLYQDPISTRERHLGLMALGNSRDNW